MVEDRKGRKGAGIEIMTEIQMSVVGSVDIMMEAEDEDQCKVVRATKAFITKAVGSMEAVDQVDQVVREDAGVMAIGMDRHVKVQDNMVAVGTIGLTLGRTGSLDKTKDTSSKPMGITTIPGRCSSQGGPMMASSTKVQVGYRKEAVERNNLTTNPGKPIATG